MDCMEDKCRKYPGLQGTTIWPLKKCRQFIFTVIICELEGFDLKCFPVSNLLKHLRSSMIVIPSCVLLAENMPKYLASGKKLSW